MFCLPWGLILHSSHLYIPWVSSEGVLWEDGLFHVLSSILAKVNNRSMTSRFSHIAPLELEAGLIEESDCEWTSSLIWFSPRTPVKLRTMLQRRVSQKTFQHPEPEVRRSTSHPPWGSAAAELFKCLSDLRSWAEVPTLSPPVHWSLWFIYPHSVKLKASQRRWQMLINHSKNAQIYFSW